MPLTRPITSEEEDITLSLSTTITGLLQKYNNNQKPVMLSVVANVGIFMNQLIESANITFTEKTKLREDMKMLIGRALRQPLSVVMPDGKPAVIDEE